MLYSILPSTEQGWNWKASIQILICSHQLLCCTILVNSWAWLFPAGPKMAPLCTFSVIITSLNSTQNFSKMSVHGEWGKSSYRTKWHSHGPVLPSMSGPLPAPDTKPDHSVHPHRYHLSDCFIDTLVTALYTSFYFSLHKWDHLLLFV
jgi:hypothetical protein